MTLVQILLPVYDGEGARFPQPMYDEVARELTEAFGGLTAEALERRFRQDELVVRAQDIRRL